MDVCTVDTKNVYAVLHYNGASSAEPTTKAEDGVSNLLAEQDLVPLENRGAPGGNSPATRSIDLAFTRSVVNGALEVCISYYFSSSVKCLLTV